VVILGSRAEYLRCRAAGLEERRVDLAQENRARPHQSEVSALARIAARRSRAAGSTKSTTSSASAPVLRSRRWIAADFLSRSISALTSAAPIVHSACTPPSAVG